MQIYKQILQHVLYSIELMHVLQPTAGRNYATCQSCKSLTGVGSL